MVGDHQPLKDLIDGHIREGPHGPFSSLIHGMDHPPIFTRHRQFKVALIQVVIGDPRFSIEGGDDRSMVAHIGTWFDDAAARLAAVVTELGELVGRVERAWISVVASCHVETPCFLMVVFVVLVP